MDRFRLINLNAMIVQDIVQQALTAVKAQPVRTFLIVLAMSIGITAVSVLVALSESARDYIINEFESLGTHLVIVLPGKTETTGAAPPIFGETPRDLTLDDAEAVGKSQHIAAIAPLTTGLAPVSVASLEREATIFGSTRALMQVRHLTLLQGQFLPETAIDQSVSVCVIGHAIRKELFGDAPAIGQWLRINDRRFRVIGVLASEGESIGVDFDEMVIIPVVSAQALFNNRSLFRILVETQSRQSMAKAIEDIQRIIRLRHEGEDDVTIITQDSVIGAFNKILTALTIAVGSIAGVSLFVAGVLVMNVMLVSVSQRTAEVGLLKAIGATSRQIQLFFLVEALLLSIVGALSGMILGRVLLFYIQVFYPAFPIALPAWAWFSALGVSIFTGLLFGVIPARKAGKLDPVLALSRR